MEISQLKNADSQNISLKETKSISIKVLNSILAVNNRYIISETLNQSLKIEDVVTNSISFIKYDSFILIVKFHPKYENIFLLVNSNNIKIYEIKKDKCEEKVSVNGHYEPIKEAVFSNTDDTIFATFSLDKTLKIWNLEDPFCICSILMNNLIDEIQIYKNYLFYYDEAKNAIIKYDYNNFEFKEIFQYNTKNYNVIDENKICLFYLNSLSIIENKIEIKKYNFTDIYYQSFYDEDIDLLYIFYANHFEILNLKNMISIFSIKRDGEPRIFYSNILNELNVCANFIFLSTYRISYYSLYYENGYILKKFLELFKKKKNISDNFVPTISNIDNLKWEYNCKENVVSKKCLLLKNEAIKKALGDNYDKSLEEKKNEVEKEINILKESTKKDYIQLLKLIIQDNTNIDLIIEYLKYLKKNEEELKLKYGDNIEYFNEEYENYKIILNNNQLKENDFEEKICPQKKVFMDLLERINNLKYNEDDNEIVNINNINTINNDINNENNNKKENDDQLNIFINEIDELIKHLQLFNQPIDITNTESYWQRNCHILYYALKKILKNKSKLKLMKETINMILKKKILDKEYVINNNILLTNIIMLIVIPQTNENLEYNLNLIETKDPNYNYNNEINNQKNPNFNIFKKGKKNSYYITQDEKIYVLNEPSKKCIKNFVLNVQKKISLEEFEEKTYDGLKDFFNQIIDFKTMKLFLSKIFSSRVIKEAFKYLYPSNYKFPFKTQKEASDFLDKYYHFIPLKLANTAGVTEKFSLEIYYILKNRKISISKALPKAMHDLVKKILYKGAVTKTSCHEINHDFYNILLMHSNGTIPLQTPKKQYIPEREGGRNMEVILFDHKIYKLSLIECLYLLNEKNYEKSLQDFRKGFNQLKTDELKFEDDCLFKEFNTILKIENFSEIANNIEITCEGNEESNFWKDTYIDDIEDVNDILGFIRDPSKL